MKKVKDTRMVSYESLPKDDRFQIWQGSADSFQGSSLTPEFRINKHGFRTDEFLEKTDKDIILTAGCSVTFGVGLYEKETWPKILENHVNDSNIVFYNISRPGWSTFQIISNVFLYLRNFKQPKEIYILLPDEGRTSGYSFVENLNGTFIISPFLEKQEDYEKEILLSNAVHVKNYLFMLEQYCRKQGIRLFVTTWNANNLVNKNHGFLHSYYPYKENEISLFLHEYQLKNKECEIALYARDNVHVGVAYHEYWGSMFYKLKKDTP